MLADRAGDLALELLDLEVELPEHRDQPQHEPAADRELPLADATLSRTPKLRQQPPRILPAAIARARQERPQAPRPARAVSAGLG
jgi:hypothetical protein